MLSLFNTCSGPFQRQSRLCYLFATVPMARCKTGLLRLSHGLRIILSLCDNWCLRGFRDSANVSLPFVSSDLLSNCFSKSCSHRTHFCAGAPPQGLRFIVFFHQLCNRLICLSAKWEWDQKQGFLLKHNILLKDHNSSSVLSGHFGPPLLGCRAQRLSLTAGSKITTFLYLSFLIFFPCLFAFMKKHCLLLLRLSAQFPLKDKSDGAC